MPIPKKEMMKRLDDSKRAAGLVKKSYWLTQDEAEKVKRFIDELRAAK